MTNPVPNKVITNINNVEPFLVNPRPSSKNAITGWSIDKLLVIAAKNSMKNHKKPKTCPPGISANTFGNALNPNEKELEVKVAKVVAPKKIKAAGIVMVPPRQTSKNSVEPE